MLLQESTPNRLRSTKFSLLSTFSFIHRYFHHIPEPQFFSYSVVKDMRVSVAYFKENPTVFDLLSNLILIF